MKKLTRRKFLKTGVAGSLAIGNCSIAAVALPKAASGALSKDSASVVSFTQGERATLSAAVDLIIPAAEGMPSATDVGAMDYLARRAQEMPQLRADLKQTGATLDEVSQARFRAKFSALNSKEKVQVLKEMESAASPKLFATLRDFTYEAYYTSPRVWKLIGYDFFPANSGGPEMQPFDEGVLREVRKKPRNYREV
jgi:gluconate 2-dehydrogenase subunit 3-like protein